MSERHDRTTPDVFAVECPGCRAHLAVPRDLVGRAAGCPACHGAFLVPAARLDATPERPSVPEPRRSKAVAAQPERGPAPEFRAAAAPAPRDEPVVFAEPPLPSTRQRLAAPDAAPTAVPGPSAAAAPTAALGHDTGPLPPAADAAAVTAATDLAFREPTRTIRSGGAEIELRRLTPEEQRARRARRNLLIMVVGAALLVALVVMLGKGGR